MYGKCFTSTQLLFPQTSKNVLIEREVEYNLRSLGELYTVAHLPLFFSFLFFFLGGGKGRGVGGNRSVEQSWSQDLHQPHPPIHHLDSHPRASLLLLTCVLYLFRIFPT
jgi:hypothetical protein